MFALLGLGLGIGCSDNGSGDDPNPKGESTGLLSDAEKVNLYDKVWKSTSSSGGIDLEFLTGGTFRQAKSLEGTWNWINKGDTMRITDYNNSTFNYLFDAISANSMTFRTNSGGNGYKTSYTYVTE